MAEESLRVAINLIAPLVMEESPGVYSGFEIDVWEAVAKDVPLGFEYEKHTFNEIIALVENGAADIGLGGITITERREHVVDFSYPILDSGLLISVNAKKNNQGFLGTGTVVLQEAGRLVRSAGLLVFAFIMVMGNLLWFAEKPVHTFGFGYFPNIFNAFWFVIESMSTVGFGDYVPHTWAGKAITSAVIIGGAAVFGILIAQVTAALAVRKVRGEIIGTRDLRGKQTATVEGTTSASVLRRAGAHVKTVHNASAAYELLVRNEIDAVLFDAPTAVYHEKNDPGHNIQSVGEVFEKQKYGFVLQQGASYREMVNRSFLKLKESGVYDSLYRKWFGDDLIMED